MTVAISRVHDWSVSRQIVDTVGVPVFLAGGLRAANVVDVLQEVGPHGVDVCSGVRRDGHLAPDRLEPFALAVRSWRRP